MGQSGVGMVRESVVAASAVPRDIDVLNTFGRQFGLITRRQARALGISDRMISRRLERGLWIRVHPGVFRLAGSPATWEQELFSAILWAGSSAAASHRSAARIHGLKGEWSDAIEVISPKRLRNEGSAVFYKRCVTPEDVVQVGGIPTTSISRTILDLATKLALPSLELTLDDALRRNLVSVQWLQWRMRNSESLDSRAIKTVTGLLTQRQKLSAPPESHLEQLCWGVIKRAGLPLPNRQVPISGGRFRLDFAYVSRKICIECDGYAFHSSKQDWQRDIEKSNFLAGEGWLVVRTTWDELTRRPDRFVRRLRHLLARSKSVTE